MQRYEAGVTCTALVRINEAARSVNKYFRVAIRMVLVLQFACVWAVGQ
jgi:hypothetical protein